MKRNNQKSTQKYDAVTSSQQQSTAVASTRVHQPVHQSADYSSVDSQDRQPVINQAAIELLESWQAGDEQEQRDTWDYLKRVLEEDRLSDRILFP